MITACYVRVSTKDQAEKYGSDVQRQQISAYLAARGWVTEDAQWFVDAQTGRTEKREQWQALMELAREGKLKRLVFTKIDRVARDDQLFIKLANELDTCGVEMVCIAQPFDSGTLFGRFIMKQMALISWFEVETLRERTLSGHENEVSTGLNWGGTPPYGYAVDGERDEAGWLVVVPREAGVVQWVFKWADLDGMTTRQIAKELDGHGHSTRSGGPWSHATVAKILQRRDFYAGHAGTTDHELAPGAVWKHEPILKGDA